MRSTKLPRSIAPNLPALKSISISAVQELCNARSSKALRWIFLSPLRPIKWTRWKPRAYCSPARAKTWCGIALVLIVPKEKKGIAGFQDLAGPEVKVIAVGEPQTVPAGKYAQEILTHFGLYEKLKPKFVLGKDVRQVLTYVATGNADAGIVYATDAKTSDAVTVVATAPKDSHSPVIYPLAIVKDSKNVEDAKKFVDFLLGPQAAEVFAKFGFQSPKE